ncbi:CopC domain-containing protein YobA [Siccibacter colletis]|uniref:CopC domain-containing protein YobA n=1 Tax=Siccibacter colletis TaxID=1505757 RepID=UPI003CF8252E
MSFSRRMLSSLLTLTATLAFSSAALAHAHLTQQTPAANAAVSEAPKALTLNFSEGVEQNFSKVVLLGPDDQPVATGKATLNASDDKQLLVPVNAPLKTGRYQVQWQVVSVDGHKTKGTYAFSIK